MKNNILWDLDGTLTDPKEGIIKCIQYALEKFGLTTPADSTLDWCIGPPLHESFKQLAPSSSKDEIDLLVNYYRERFAGTGLYENKIYPVISEVLAELSQSKKLFLATSKPHIFANRILIHFEIAKYFHKVYGSEISGERSDKAELIEYILKQEKLDPENVYMIGDRRHDVIGAKKNKVESIGVTWGYGGREELLSSEADIIFDNPTDLKNFLLSNK
jgi:phosphoglycolate phosphatase